MPSSVEQLNPTRVKLTIEMPFAELQPKIDTAYKKISEQVNLPGFRRGKVPAKLIDQRFGRGTVLQEAINDAIPEAYAHAVKEHEIIPMGQPEIEVTKLEDGDVVEFSAEVDVRPDFEIPDLSGISVEVESAEVSDEDVDERVKLLRDRFGTLTEVDRAAAEGDVVVFDLSATQDGNPVPDAEASDMQYRLGDGGMVEGLDEALTGMEAGQVKTFTSKLAGGLHQGEDADIQVNVTKVNSQELPEVDDDFAQMVSEFDTAEEMLADLRDNLERMSRIGQANSARDKVLENVLSRVDFELPASVLENEVKGYHDQIDAQLNQAGMTIEQYLQNSGDEEEADTPEEFWKDVDERAEPALRAPRILDNLAEVRNVPVSQEEFTRLVLQKAQQSGTSPEQQIQAMTENNNMPEWLGEIRRGKALSEIVNDAVVTDSAGAVIDLEHLQADGSIVIPDESSDDVAEAEDSGAEADVKAPEAEVSEDTEAEAPAEDEKPVAKASKPKKAAAKTTTTKKTPAKKPAARKTTKKAVEKADED
ncbi:trigger factor [Propionibacterium sp.]|uniref:trigger factor n=1 Tax=Propionibacterium sp. TaxID=1977903 RepID=UPI0039E8FD6A